MREVRVHFEDVVVALLQSPFESGQIGCSKSEFSCALDHEQPVAELGLKAFDNGGGSVRGAVIYDKHVEISVKGEHFSDDCFDVFLLVVSRNDDDFPVHKYSIIILFSSSL